MKKYLIVSGDRLTEFPTILFVHNGNKITVYSAVEQSRKTWQSYVDRQKTTSIERLASRFSYANTDFGVVDNKKQLEIDKIIKSMPAAVKPITAGFGDDSSAERRARAKLQRRDRYGRFAEMGGGFSFSIRGLGGAADKLSGRVVGTSGTDDIEIEVIGNKTISDGIYALPASKGETVKAILSLDAVEGLPENKALVDQSLAVDVSEIKALSQPSDWTPRKVADGAPREWLSQDGLITRQFADGYVVYEMDVFDDADTSKEVGRGDSWVDIQKASADFRENGGVQTQPASTTTESTATPAATSTQKDRAEDFSEAEVEKLRQRQAELEAMPVDELNELFSDGEYIYVVHAGSEEIKGDVFNPAMTVGSDELVYEGNTKNINRMYSDKYIAEYENNRSTLRTLNHIIERLKNGEMIDDQTYPRTPDDDDRGSSLPTVSSVLFDVATRGGPYLNFPSTMRQGKPWPDPADLEKIGITREELIDYLEKVGVPLIQKKIDSKQQIVDQLRADDGQFTSSYEIPTVVQGARLHGYGGRYGEGYDPNAPKGKGESFDIGNRQERQGIHIARVKIGTDADRLGGVQTIHENQAKEVHMVGEHEVVASLTTPTWIRFAISQDEKDRFGEDFFKAWMEEAVNADKEKRRAQETPEVPETPETTEPRGPRVVNGVTQRETRLPQGIEPVNDFSEAVEKGLPWSPLLAQNYPPEIQKAIDKFYEMTDREKLVNIGFTADSLNPEKRAYDKEELIKIGNEIYQYFASVGVSTEGRESDFGWTYDGSFLDIIIDADKGGAPYSPAFLMTTALIQRANSDIRMQAQIESGRVSPEGIMEIAENFNHDRVMSVVPLSAIDSVLGTRRIMSQFEVGESMGYLAPGFRSTLEADQYGYPPNMRVSSRPIYGVSVPERMNASDFRWSEGTYGELRFIMKNEVQSRTTYTMGDSANADARPAPIGVVAPTSMYDNGTIHAEAQIHGSVSLDDVLEVVVREDAIDPNVMEELREKVRAAGLIFTVIQMENNDFLSFVDLKVDGAVATIVKAPKSVV